MSFGKIINAVIALVEDRPSDAKEMLRSPEMQISVGEVQSRLAASIYARERAAKISVLKDVLRNSIRIDADTIEKDNPAHREAFLRGVTVVESIVENYLATLEA